MKYTGLLSLVCSAALIMTGCSSASNLMYDKAPEEESLKVYSTTASDMNGASMDYYADYDGAEMGVKESSSSKNDLSSRKIIKTANLSFETEKYDEFIPAIENCIFSLGGYIESSEAYGGGISSSRSRSSYITVRIPEDNYDRFMTEAGEIGTLTYKSESSDDVTLNYVDTESRLKSLQTEYDALIEILEKASSLDDIIQLQSRISEVTYQIESYQSQLRKYDDLIAYCTVRIDISEVRRVSQNEETMSFGERISSGLYETLTDISKGFSDFAVGFIVNLPYIAIWAVIIAAVVLVIGLCIKKHRKNKEKKLIDQIVNSINEKES